MAFKPKAIHIPKPGTVKADPGLPSLSAMENTLMKGAAVQPKLSSRQFHGGDLGSQTASLVKMKKPKV